MNTPLLDSHAILHFGNDWAGGNRTSSHHVARRLAERYPLLYIDNPGLRAPTASGRDLSKIWRKLSSALQAPRQLGPKLWHMTMPVIPYRGLPGVGGLNRIAGGRLIRRAVKRLGFRKTVSLFFVPHPGFLAGRCGESMSAFYVVDDYASLPGVDAARVAAMDEQLSRRVDLIFAVSPALVEGKRRLNANVVYSPHGVDVEMFSRADGTAPEAAALRRPIAGFVGALDGRIDFALLEFLARARPQWTFLLVGSVGAGGSDRGLRSLPNVVMPGAAPYETVPLWVRSFDVCMMPYRAGAFGASANPLKLQEYLATGRPVVSIGVPDAGRLGHGTVAQAESPQQFLEHLEAELAGDNEARRQRRRQTVAGMSWDARVDEVIAQLERGLAAKLS